jgi:hypothetical protein
MPNIEQQEDVNDKPTEQIGDSKWRAHPLASVTLRSIIVVIPLAIATVIGLLIGGSIGGNTMQADVTRVLVAGVVSLITFVITEHVSRRFLPLSMLLKLSLVFPDQAPSRFTVALRSSSVKKLQQWAKSAQVDEGPAALAEKVVTLATALNSHDRRTRGHSDRSRAMAELIGAEMGLTPEELNEVRWGAFLHDIGKILVPAALLNKPGKPTTSEWETLKRHPAAGAELVEPLRAFLGSGVEAVGGHHENFDGSGYPKGLVGNDIPLAARIVSVADSFEVMTAVRAYKKPMKATEAREELTRNSGTQFDPVVVRALLNVSLGRLHWTLGLAAWVAEMPFLTVIPRVAAQGGTFAVGPTVTMGALSSVAAISLGSALAPAGLMFSSSHSPISSSGTVLARSLSADGSGATVPAKSSVPALTGSATDPPSSQSLAPAGGSTNGASSAATSSPSTTPWFSGNSTPSTSSSEGTGTSVPARSAGSAKEAGPAPATAPAKEAGSTPAAAAITPASPGVPDPAPAEAAPVPAPGPAASSVPASTPTPTTPPPSTGNPHQPGQTGNPHQPGQTSNPHG